MQSISKVMILAVTLVQPKEPQDIYLEMAPPVTSRKRRQWWGTNSNSLLYIAWRPLGWDWTYCSTITCQEEFNVKCKKSEHELP